MYQSSKTPGCYASQALDKNIVERSSERVCGQNDNIFISMNIFDKVNHIRMIMNDIQSTSKYLSNIQFMAKTIHQLI